MVALIEEGASVVRRDLIAFLKAAVPPALGAARTAWSVDRAELADVRRWNEYEDESVADVAPSVALTIGRSRDHVRRDLEPGADMVYQARYECVLFCWTKALPGRPLQDGGEQQPNPSQRKRDRYADVFRAVLLDSPSLGKPGIYRLDETSLVVGYSAAQRLKGDRYLSGVSLAFDLRHTETLRRVPTLGNVAHTDVEATVLVGNQAD